MTRGAVQKCFKNDLKHIHMRLNTLRRLVAALRVRCNKGGPENPRGTLNFCCFLALHVANIIIYNRLTPTQVTLCVYGPPQARKATHNSDYVIKRPRAQYVRPRHMPPIIEGQGTSPTSFVSFTKLLGGAPLVSTLANRVAKFAQLLRLVSHSSRFRRPFNGNSFRLDGPITPWPALP